MLLLTATNTTQGQMPGDFCDAIEGELVVIFSDCHVRAHEDDLLRCREGCPARFFGLNSHQSTTTAMVRDVQISREDYLLAITAYGEHRGSGAPVSMACYLATRMVDASAAFLPGTVVGLTDRKTVIRAETRHGWRDYAATARSIARAFSWRRHFDKTIRSIDEGQHDSQPPVPDGGGSR